VPPSRALGQAVGPPNHRATVCAMPCVGHHVYMNRPPDFFRPITHHPKCFPRRRTTLRVVTSCLLPATADERRHGRSSGANEHSPQRLGTLSLRFPAAFRRQRLSPRGPLPGRSGARQMTALPGSPRTRRSAPHGKSPAASTRGVAPLERPAGKRRHADKGGPRAQGLSARNNASAVADGR
jgi:hypothetical protein